MIYHSLMVLLWTALGVSALVEGAVEPVSYALLCLVLVVRHLTDMWKETK